MTTKSFVLVLNTILTILIFFNAELGQYFGIQEGPLPISVVWPSTGFALAALLLFGLKAWPGVFLGNFFYNLHQLVIFNFSGASLLIALIVSGGSLLQALVGNYVIRKFSSGNFLKSVHDVMIFLIPGGVLTCLIASGIGTTTLYFYEGMTRSWQSVLYLWLTFWIGDTMGVYIFTPLILIWSTQKFKKVDISKYIYFILSILFFVAIYFLEVKIDFSLSIFYILLSLLITYHFGLHGATLGTFLMTLVLIIPYSRIGYPSTPTVLIVNPLLFFVLLLETIVATSLVFAAVKREGISRRLT